MRQSNTRVGAHEREQERDRERERERERERYVHSRGGVTHS